MAMAKVSLTLPESLLTPARRLVGQRGLSGYVAEALRNQLQRDRITGLLAELEKEAGAIDLKIQAEVREAWPDPASAKPLRRSA